MRNQSNSMKNDIRNRTVVTPTGKNSTPKSTKNLKPDSQQSEALGKQQNKSGYNESIDSQSNKQTTKQKDVSSSIEHLKTVLADTFVLYMKTYAVHWNFKGAKFFSVHKMTEAQYQELADAIDEIAERIRAKGGEAPISLSSILGTADVNEFQAHSAGTDKAIAELADGHTTLAKKAKEAADQMEEEGDLFSNDMMVARIGAHEKAAWMLRSFLER